MKGMKWKGVLIGFLRLIEELGSGRRVSKNRKNRLEFITRTWVWISTVISRRRVWCEFESNLRILYIHFSFKIWFKQPDPEFKQNHWTGSRKSLSLAFEQPPKAEYLEMSWKAHHHRTNYLLHSNSSHLTSALLMKQSQTWNPPHHRAQQNWNHSLEISRSPPGYHHTLAKMFWIGGSLRFGLHSSHKRDSKPFLHPAVWNLFVTTSGIFVGKYLRLTYFGICSYSEFR